MHNVIELWYRLWFWLLENSASRATVILVIITTVYVILTWRMTNAIARQTRALIQPVASLEFLWTGKQYSPVGCFEIKNLGVQPLLLLDVKLWCRIYNGREFTKHYTLWDEHIIPPGKSLTPQFDFMTIFEKEKLLWDSDWMSYSLEVVASDLSKQVVLTYQNIPVLHVVNVRRGMPLSVHWRYLLKPFASRYKRLLNRFMPSKNGIQRND
jgi:hypothetical protein